MLSEKQAPFIEPYSHPGGQFKSKGPTAEAVKRALSHLGLMSWTDFDQTYGEVVYAAMAHFKRNQGLIPKNSSDGSYGEGAWTKLRNRYYTKGGQYLPVFDGYAQKLLQDEAKAVAESTAMARVQDAIKDFWTIAIQNAAAWHYSQSRPYRVDVDPANGGYSDCSAMVVQSSHYAAKKTGVPVPDPSKNSYSGYGNTDLYEDDWPKVWSPYRIGDLAHFAAPRHVICCIAPGTRTTAKWGSNGSEAAPELIDNLSAYRADDFMFVVRPTLVP